MRRLLTSLVLLAAPVTAQLQIDELGHGLELVQNGGLWTLQTDTTQTCDVGRDNVFDGTQDFSLANLIAPRQPTAPPANECSVAKYGALVQEMDVGVYQLWTCWQPSPGTYEWRKVLLLGDIGPPPGGLYPPPASSWDLFSDADHPPQILVDEGTEGQACRLGSSSSPDSSDPAWTDSGFLRFSGKEQSAQYLDCGGRYNFDARVQDFSISIWARARSLTGGDTVISKAFAAGSHDGWVFQIFGRNPVETDFGFDGQGNLEVYNETAGATLGVWRHYGIVYRAAPMADPDEIEIYIDGKLVGQTVRWVTLQNGGQSTAKLRIGAVEDSRGFDGALALTKIWEIPLDGLDMAEVCTEGFEFLTGLGQPANACN